MGAFPSPMSLNVKNAEPLIILFKNVKFLRYGQYFIEKNGSGVLVFINPHGFLDNPIFRGMRWYLLKTFDKIYTLDLHGNSQKKEVAPDGSKDENVFDIKQGVPINIFVKNGKKSKQTLANVFHYDLYGRREDKYKFLLKKSLSSINFNRIKYTKSYYFFKPKKEKGIQKYEKGFSVKELFPINNTGIITSIDELSIFLSKTELKNVIEKILFIEDLYREYNITDTRRTTKEGRLAELKNAYKRGIIPISYRPFDLRFALPFEKNGSKTAKEKSFLRMIYGIIKKSSWFWLRRIGLCRKLIW